MLNGIVQAGARLSVFQEMYRIISDLFFTVGKREDEGPAGSVIGTAIRAASGIIGSALHIGSYFLWVLPLFTPVGWVQVVVMFASAQYISKAFLDVPETLNKAMAWLRLFWLFMQTGFNLEETVDTVESAAMQDELFQSERGEIKAERRERAAKKAQRHKMKENLNDDDWCPNEGEYNVA